MFYDIYLYTLCYYICCLLGACMRCTWPCSLKSGVTRGRGGAGRGAARRGVAWTGRVAGAAGRCRARLGHGRTPAGGEGGGRGGRRGEGASPRRGRRRRRRARERAAAVRAGKRERGRENDGRGPQGRGGRLGQKWGRRGEEKKKVFFLFPKIYFPLDECIHIFKQSKGMHGSAWCITQNKVF
jgi:hypothetical protein